MAAYLQDISMKRVYWQPTQSMVDAAGSVATHILGIAPATLQSIQAEQRKYTDVGV